MLYTLHFNTQLPRGLAVRISGFHPGGPGSIPGVGTNFFPFLICLDTTLKLEDLEF